MTRAALRAVCTAALLLSALGRTDPQPLAAIARCALHVGDGGWLAASASRAANGTHVAARSSERQEAATPVAWAWDPVASSVCGLRALPRSHLASLLRGVRVGVLGDSVARLFYAALLRAMGLSPEQRVVTGHRSFAHSLASGAHGSFIWAPYGENISAALRGWHAAGTAPDIVVAGASLWHMLHVGDGADYAASLRDVREALMLLRDDGAPVSANSTVAAAKRRHALPPLFFWMSTTALVTPKLPTEEKRARLTPEAVASYNALARQERLLLPSGPCAPLDVHRITRDCGPDCAADGMHFINATYDALVQQWANGVRLMWRAAYCASRRERRTLRWRSGTTEPGLCEPPDVDKLPAELHR